MNQIARQGARGRKQEDRGAWAPMVMMVMMMIARISALETVAVLWFQPASASCERRRLVESRGQAMKATGFHRSLSLPIIPRHSFYCAYSYYYCA